MVVIAGQKSENNTYQFDVHSTFKVIRILINDIITRGSIEEI